MDLPWNPNGGGFGRLPNIASWLRSESRTQYTRPILATVDLTPEGPVVHRERYWRLDYLPKTRLTEDEAAEGLREKLDEAVRLRLVSDGGEHFAASRCHCGADYRFALGRGPLTSTPGVAK